VSPVAALITDLSPRMGVILGTAAYMSPEQATGKAVDKRSDLWAFGVVLLEMLTGRPMFWGETVAHVLASVLSEPDWTALPASTPPALCRLLRRSLEKDRYRRLSDIAKLTGSAASGRRPCRPKAQARAAAATAMTTATDAHAMCARRRDEPEPAGLGSVTR
jgi:serine/threonine protein kinase